MSDEQKPTSEREDKDQSGGSEERTPKPSKSDVEETTKGYQESKGEEPDSSSKFAEAAHDARNDAQDAGEELPNRDRSSK
jgi:hypothetical protein